MQRTSKFPPLPRGGPRLSIVLPTKGDLRLRSLLPSTFIQQFAIHCNAEHQHIYAKFVIIRQFIVMSSDGNLFTQTLRTQLRIEDLPNRSLLPLPTTLTQWDITKVLDLVQCYTFGPDQTTLLPNVRWELVRVRWRSNHETWVPIELLMAQSPALLQEFYMSTVNSWGFVDRIKPQSLGLYRAEIELWLIQSEFQKFYEQLRRRQSLLATSSTQNVHANESSRPIAPPSAPQVTSATPINGNTVQTDVKDRRLVEEARRTNEPVRPPVRAPAGAIRPSIRERTQIPQTASAPTAVTTMPQPSALQRQDAPVPLQRQATPPPPPRQPTPPPQQRSATPPVPLSRQSTPPPTQASQPSSVSKQVEREPVISDDDSPQPKKKKKKPSDSSAPSTPIRTSSDHNRSQRQNGTSPETQSTGRKRRRLKWSQAKADSSDESDDLLDLSQSKTSKKKSSSKDPSSTKKRNTTTISKDPKASDEQGTANVPIELSDDSDADDNDDGATSAFESMIDREAADYSDGDHIDSDDDENGGASLIGDIRCECGARSVGRYRGKWLQCSQDSCGKWQHAQCVGYITPPTGNLYKCSKCDPAAYAERVNDAKTKMRKWLSACCKNHNQRLLLKLLDDEERRDVKACVALVRSENRSRTLLMEAARNGLSRAVRRLIRRYKVDAYALDSRSRNVLHHAVKGKSQSLVSVVKFLLKQAPPLVRHQDLTGQMPLHLMLQSRHLNGLCLSLLQENQALCVTSDFSGTMPIHYASRVVNCHTAAIMEEIVMAQPSAALDPSPKDGLTPFLQLCRAAGGVTRTELVSNAASVQDVVQLFLDSSDMLGRFLHARDAHGSTAMHMTAESGNHVLLQYLCQLEGVEVDAISFDVGETALHVAAKGSSADVVRVLLENRGHQLNVCAVDASRFIPALRATDASVLQQLLHYDLHDQLRRVSDLARRFQHHEVLREWLGLVVGDPMCYAIVNDWLQENVARLDELDDLVVLHRSLARIDNKLDYLYNVMLPSVQSQFQYRRSNGSNDLELTLSSASSACYWRQFMDLAQDLDAPVFRRKLQLAVSRGSGGARIDNLTLVLVRLLSGLLNPTTGLLIRDPADNTLKPSPSLLEDDVPTLRGFYVLGELVAHFVIQKVTLEVMEFSTPFLQCVVGQAGQASPPPTNATRVFAESFAAGFEAVLPSTLALLHVPELRVMLHARKQSFNVLTVDWATAVEWIGFDQTSNDGGNTMAKLDVAVTWWTRLVTELVDEERVALVLWLTGSFHHTERSIFGGATSDNPPTARVRIERHKTSSTRRQETDGTTVVIDEDELLPVLDDTTHTLVMPSYSTYAAFQIGLLHVFRAVDSVVTVR